MVRRIGSIPITESPGVLRRKKLNQQRIDDDREVDGNDDGTDDLSGGGDGGSFHSVDPSTLSVYEKLQLLSPKPTATTSKASTTTRGKSGVKCPSPPVASPTNSPSPRFHAKPKFLPTKLPLTSSSTKANTSLITTTVSEKAVITSSSCVPKNKSDSNDDKKEGKKTLTFTKAAKSPSSMSLSNKPSEIRAALTTQRAAARAEQNRKMELLKNQQLAQMRMDKIRAEINAIKQAQQHSKDDGQDDGDQQLHQKSHSPRLPPLQSSTSSLKPSSSSFTLVPEMRRRPANRDLLFDSDSHHNRTCCVDDNASGSRRSKHIVHTNRWTTSNQRSDVIDELRQNMSTHSPITGRQMIPSQAYFSSSSQSSSSSSSSSSQLSLSSLQRAQTTNFTHRLNSGSTSNTFSSPKVESKSPLKTTGTKTGLSSKGSSETNSLKPSNKQLPSSFVLIAEPTSPRSTSNTSSNKTLGCPKTPTTMIRCSITTTPKKTPRHTKQQIAKMEEEKARREEQRKKLDEAKSYFATGHELCWKFQDSGSALAEYRKALFIRESLLGKYHDETGRLYYWIGRSLIKLKIYTEALVALTRAQRIFERVLSPTQKYRKWTEQAIESVFRQMGGYYTVSPLATTTANEPTDGAKGQVANDVDDEHTAEETECTDDNDDSEADGGDSCGGEDGSTGEHDLEKISHDMFKLGVGQSIDRERTGDAYRREGSIDEAISEYRLAISLMNSLMHAHPDSADLYCKIAMLLRQQGCFDLALEEQKDALAIYELSLGMEHPEALKTLSQTIEKKRTNQMQLAILEKLEASKKS